MAKSELNQALEQPKYILLNTGWRDNLLFTISDGMKYLELQASAIRIEGELDSDRKDPIKISANSRPVTFSYMTESRFKQLRMESMMEPKEEA